MPYEIGQHLIHRQFGDGYTVVKIETTTTMNRSTSVYTCRKDDNAQERVAELTLGERLMEQTFVNNDRYVEPGQTPGEDVNVLNQVIE